MRPVNLRHQNATQKKKTHNVDPNESSLWSTYLRGFSYIHNFWAFSVEFHIQDFSHVPHLSRFYVALLFFFRIVGGG